MKVDKHSVPRVVAVGLSVVALGAATAPASAKPVAQGPFQGTAALHAVRAVAAGEVRCGATITADTTLDRDLVNCQNNGIVIGADHVTLDLNGHTIDGNGTLVDECPPNEFCDLGVNNGAGYDGVTIKNGSVRDFAVGVLGIDTSNNRLLRLSVSRSMFPGIVIGESNGTLVRRNSIVRNGLTTDQAGLVIFASHRIRIDKNQVSNNGDIGLFMVDSSNDSWITKNTLAENPEAGMMLEGSRNEVRRNRLLRNGDGIVVGGNSNVISGNHVSTATRCPDGCGYGISFEGGAHNVVAHNHVADARRAGIRVDAYGTAASGTVIRANIVHTAGVDGIAINLDHAGPVKNTLLAANKVMGAGDDGIDVESASTTLTRNVTVHNTDLGIEAVAGVTDGGGNHAAGNGDPRQCTHVTCRP